MVTGTGREVGEEIIGSPEIDAISFTGSTEVGHRINRKIPAGKKLVRIELELGGENAGVVFHEVRFKSVLPLINVDPFFVPRERYRRQLNMFKNKLING